MTQQFVEQQQKDDSIMFRAILTDDDDNPITTGVTIDIIKPDGTYQATGQTATLYDAVTGEWRYIVAAADVDAYGIWTGHWHWTVNSTVRAHRRIAEVRHL